MSTGITRETEGRLLLLHYQLLGNEPSVILVSQRQAAIEKAAAPFY